MATCHCFFFIDAMGAAITAEQPVIRDILPHFSALRSVFGYSSACVPSILTGRYPEEHGHWSYFTHRGPRNGLQLPGWLRFIPGAIRDRGRVRRHLSRAVAVRNQIEGYFQLYNLPLAHARDYGHCEPHNIFTPGGINNGTSIIDDLEVAGMLTGSASFISNWHHSAEHNWAAMTQAVTQSDCQFAFMYDAHLDGWLHTHTRQHNDLPDKLAAIASNIQAVQRAAEASHDEVLIYVFSDHGMCTITNHCNVFPYLERSGLRMHHDYHAIIDSTMVRTWYPDLATRERIRDVLVDVPGLQRLSAGELARLGCNFPDARFGDDIFLADPGCLLVPSHMGTRPIAGMHGYHPDHIDSDATFLTNDPEADPRGIIDLYSLMHRAVNRSVQERAA